MHAGQPGRGRYLLAFALLALLVVGILLAVPLSLDSILDDLLGSLDGSVALVAVDADSSQEEGTNRLHLALVGLDEARRRVTLQVSGQHACGATCDHTDRLLFFSLRTNEAVVAGLPPSATMDLAPTSLLISQTLELPVHGQPNRYPFDVYELVLGIGRARVLPDGRVQPLVPGEEAEGLALTLQEQLPRQSMAGPVALDPASVQDEADPYPYHMVESLRFYRPLYLRVLAVLLVVLIGAAAVYAVFMRPLDELIINAGGVVLGVWGIRGILTPSSFVHLTAVDLALSVVILFLLGAISVRMMSWSHEKAGLPWPRPLPERAPTPPAKGPGDRCDYPGCANRIAARCSSCRQAFCPRHVSSGPTPACDSCAETSEGNGMPYRSARAAGEGSHRPRAG